MYSRTAHIPVRHERPAESVSNEQSNIYEKDSFHKVEVIIDSQLELDDKEWDEVKGITKIFTKIRAANLEQEARHSRTHEKEKDERYVFTVVYDFEKQIGWIEVKEGSDVAPEKEFEMYAIEMSDSTYQAGCALSNALPDGTPGQQKEWWQDRQASGAPQASYWRIHKWLDAHNMAHRRQSNRHHVENTRRMRQEEARRHL